MADIVQSAMLGWFREEMARASAIEALLGFGIFGKMAGENFHGDGAVKASVFGAIDLAHAASADLRLNLVRAKLGAGSQAHGCGQL